MKESQHSSSTNNQLKMYIVHKAITPSHVISDLTLHGGCYDPATAAAEAQQLIR
jgi:hypothetical protein